MTLSSQRKGERDALPLSDSDAPHHNAELTNQFFYTTMNTLDAAIPRILSQGLVALRENAVMASLVNRDYGEDARQKGSSVDVPIPSAMGDAEDVVPSNANPQGEDVTPRFVSIKLDKWKQKNFYLTDKDIQEVMQGYQNLQITEAARSLANAVDKDLLALYKKVWGVAGVGGQTPFQTVSGVAPYPAYMGLGVARDARKVLNRQLAPTGDRYMVLDVDAEANATALADFASADRSADDQVITEGRIGRKLGFDWQMDQNILSHTNTVAGTITTSGGTNLAGAQVMAVTGATAAPAEGDVVYVAGDAQPYVVGKNATLTSWPVSPRLRTDLADGSAVTPAEDGVVNLAFHRDAFALAIRPLSDIDGLGNRIETFVDDKSGIPLRLEISRQNKQTTFSFDLLYGVECVRPEYAVRLLG